jgi:hypothetical protein
MTKLEFFNNINLTYLVLSVEVRKITFGLIIDCKLTQNAKRKTQFATDNES